MMKRGERVGDTFFIFIASDKVHNSWIKSSERANERERERQREREGGREGETEAETERDRDRKTERDRDRENTWPSAYEDKIKTMFVELSVSLAFAIAGLLI